MQIAEYIVKRAISEKAILIYFESTYFIVIIQKMNVAPIDIADTAKEMVYMRLIEK